MVKRKSLFCMCAKATGLLSLVAVLLLCSGCVPEDGNYSLSAKSDLADATINVTQAEYGQGTVTPLEYLVCSNPDVTITTDDEIDTSKVGTQNVHLVLKMGFFTREEDFEVPVIDTEAPEIMLSTDSVEVEMGEEVDIESLVESVSDPVDGALEPVTQEPETQGRKVGEEDFFDKGWYLIPGKVDVDKAGTYVVTVTAMDKHGNKAAEDVAVTIVDPLEGVTLNATTTALEYSKKKLDPLKLVTCSDDDTKITADTVVPNKVGTLEVVYTLSKGKSTHEEKVSFEVEDSHAPEIKLKHSKVNLYMGDAFKAGSYIEYVKDPVDGKLQAVKKEPKAQGKDAGKEVLYDKGWYNISGKVDVDKVGKYNVVVKASDKYGNVSKKKIVVTVKDPLKGVRLTPKTENLEYSNKKTDPTKLVTCSVKDAKLSAKEISLDKTGKKKVTFNITKGSSKHKVDVTFNVRDTKAPVISFYSTEVAVDWGENFDPYSNIEFVRDEVDGDLARVSEEPAENGDGWYTITGSFDTGASSKYYLTAVACDKNGNRVEREFSLLVGDEPAPQDTQPASHERDYILNTNTYVFHYPSCRHVSRMNDSNKWYVHKTREAVMDMGYSSCGTCCP